jgi:3-oxoacyl-[acyl-carrier-protein] synthase III
MAFKTCGFGILGVGMYAPPEVITNADLERMVDTSDEWIRSRTGIVERRRLGLDEATSDMAVRAARRALDDAGMDAREIDLIICCTFGPDTPVPCAACYVQDKLGIAGHCPAFDLNIACTGFTYGLSVATAFMRAGVYKTALVIGADAVTRYLDYTQRETCILFGDGAGAAVVGPTGEDRGLMGEFLGADGGAGDMLVLRDCGTRIRTAEEKAKDPSPIVMRGNDVFKFAVKGVTRATHGALEAAGQGLTPRDIDLMIPHQANLRIIEAAAKHFGLPMEKMFVNLQKYGNTSAASIPMALAEAVQEGRLKRGDILALVSFGGGMSYGAGIWVW